MNRRHANPARRTPGELLLVAVALTFTGFSLAAESGKHPAIQSGLEIQPTDGGVTVAPGDIVIAGKTIRVDGPTTLQSPPAEVKSVSNEGIQLSAEKPAGWSVGARLRALKTTAVNAFGSLTPGSLEIRPSKDGSPLVEGQDYLLDAGWGHVGVGPSGKVTPKDTVFASYKYSLLRMDTIQVTADGKVSLLLGTPHLSAPVPPPATAGSVAIAHLYRPYNQAVVNDVDIYPILETAEQALTKTTKGRVPKTLAKLRAGEKVKIVTWGDSVTQGGDASAPEHRYANVFVAGLRERFPKAKIEFANISAGGSNSRQWLFPEKYVYRSRKISFQEIVDAQPDLVTIEFVNDAGLSPQLVDEVYSDILNRLAPTGAEVILITPHFTMWKMMKFDSMKGVEQRPYVLALRDFAERKNIALADASARWEHLWKEGVPYTTLLLNTINHPEDRGHRLFAEELWKCFE